MMIFLVDSKIVFIYFYLGRKLTIKAYKNIIQKISDVSKGNSLSSVNTVRVFLYYSYIILQIIVKLKFSYNIYGKN